MGEKGIPLQGSATDAINNLAASVGAPVTGDPRTTLDALPLDMVRDTPGIANSWMEAYLNWRQIQEARAAGAAPPPGTMPPPGASPPR